MSNFSKYIHDENDEDILVVIGSRCQLYPIDNDALKVEMLTPWMNDKSLLIDKYDARCWLSDLSSFDEIKFDALLEDIETEKMCDNERYFDLFKKFACETENDDDEKDNQNRSGSYSAVKYSYTETGKDTEEDIVDESSDHEKDEDVPYQAPPDLKLPDDIKLPKTEKEAAKIEKTATFIAGHGIQMEILLKAKQGNNKKFHFLTFDDELNPFYKFLLDKIKNAEYIPAKRQLFHLTKSDLSESDSALVLPKVDISNTAYYKLINKYRSADISSSNSKTDSEENEKSAHSDTSSKTTTPDSINQSSDTLANVEDEKEKLYKTLYEQYYTYYYNYYYQLHNNSPMLQESNQLQIQEDSKSLAINSAAYAAKAGVEQYQKDRDEMIRVEKLKQENIDKKKQLCITIRYVDYLMKHGCEFDYAVMSKSDKLKFLDPDNQYHSFYQHCLARAKKTQNKISACSEVVNEKEAKSIENHFPKWEDYIKKLPTGGNGSSNIQSAPKLVSDNHKSCITVGPSEQRLITLTSHVNGLINAEEIGRQKYIAQQHNQYPNQQQPVIVENSHLQANRKRKATEFLEKINKRNSKKAATDQLSSFKSSNLKTSQITNQK